jgi:hypothetical protein
MFTGETIRLRGPPEQRHAELNSVKRSADGEPVKILQATPLKDTSVEQKDYRLEEFTRDNTDYVALWRKGLPPGVGRRGNAGV